LAAMLRPAHGGHARMVDANWMASPNRVMRCGQIP
jgi:hypothetical protein